MNVYSLTETDDSEEECNEDAAGGLTRLEVPSIGCEIGKGHLRTT